MRKPGKGGFIRRNSRCKGPEVITGNYKGASVTAVTVSKGEGVGQCACPAPTSEITPHSNACQGLNLVTTLPESLWTGSKFLPLTKPQFLCKIQGREHLHLKTIQILLLYKTESKALLYALPCAGCQ